MAQALYLLCYTEKLLITSKVTVIFPVTSNGYSLINALLQLIRELKVVIIPIKVPLSRMTVFDQSI